MSAEEAAHPVRLCLYGDLARQAGARAHTLWVRSGAQLQDLFKIAAQEGLLPGELVEQWQTGEVTRHLIVINDRQLTLPADLGHPLRVGDEVAVIPWIVGGGDQEMMNAECRMMNDGWRE